MGNLSSGITAAQVSLSNLPERTVWVDNIVVGATCALTGQVIEYFNARATVDSNGQYEIHFTGRVDFNSATLTDAALFTLSGLNLVHGLGERINISGNPNPSTIKSYAVNNGADLELRVTTGSSISHVWLEGSLRVDAKPSWFDANREAGFSVAAQIESATDTTLGLVKTFNTTLTNTGVVGDYEEVTVELVNDGVSNLTGTVNFVRIGRLVTMGFNEPSGLTHDSISVVVSSAGVIPAGWEPAHDKRNTGQLLATSEVHVLSVGVNGSFNVRYLSSNFTSVAKAGTGQGLITWILGT